MAKQLLQLMPVSKDGRLELSQISANLSKMPKEKCNLVGLSITIVQIKQHDLWRIVIRKKIPLVFLQDVTGFMVGSKSEHSGIIKDGAKMVNALSNSVVPKFTIIIGNSYGAGNYAMCGKAYDPRLIVAWPSAALAVMSGNSAAKVLLQIETASLKKKGETITPEKEAELFDEIKSRYDAQVSPYYAASRLWTDAVINPTDTRDWISMGIEAANHAPIEKAFNMGVIQV